MMKAKTAHYGNVLQLETQKRLAYLAILRLSQRFVRGIFHPVWHYLILISPLCSGSASGPLIEKACQPPDSILRILAVFVCKRRFFTFL